MSAQSTRAGAAAKLLAFEVGGVAYALDIARIRQIVRPLPLVSLPQLAEPVNGVVEHRGDVVPIIDLRKRFGVQPEHTRVRDARFILVERAGRRLGLAVDRVSEVFDAEQAVARQPALAAGAAKALITAAYAYRGRLVFVLDLDELTAAVDGLALPQHALPAGAEHDG